MPLAGCSEAIESDDAAPRQSGPSLWAMLPSACEELILSLLSQQAMAVLACVNTSFRDHVRATRVRKRGLDLSPGAAAAP